MKRKANPTRIGLFMLGAIALLVAVVVLVSGGRLFSTTERAVAFFEGSVYGLQLGAPVVFRGVRLGSVVGLGVVYQGQPGRYAIPVEVEIERSKIGSVSGAKGEVSVADMVAQGLTAQLSTQSLLTGLLYVDLDLRPISGASSPKAPAGAGVASTAARTHGMTEIPTVASPIQALQKQLQNLNLGQLVDDISAVATSARQLVANPKLSSTIDELALASGELRKVLAQVGQRLGPLADNVQGTLGAARKTAEQWGGAVERMGSAVDRVGAAAESVDRTMGRVDRLAEAAQPTLQSVQRAAEDLARTATALRSATSEDSGLLQQFERAAQDMARASRAVRDLADLLERQPEALIRGRATAP